jgi:hypothetical protein
MVTIDFKKEFKKLPGDNSDVTIPNLNHILAFSLSRSDSRSDPVKLYGWSVKLATDGILELDKSDVGLLKEFITADKTMFVSSKGQLIELIDSVKE